MAQNQNESTPEGAEKLLQQQIEWITLTNSNLGAQQKQIVGLSASLQIVIEVMLSQSTDQKNAVAQALEQVLSRPGAVANEFAREFLSSVQKDASLPSRTTPDTRRSTVLDAHCESR
ncbi:hypothetical protein [Candidatus Methylocalor cossyra]|uniref:hypothetical protein n=1 Tax=Candidatus Methylocalor cossyra TaxID=3108543 RepID=UPI0032B2E257